MPALHHLLDGLTAAQCAAVQHRDGPLLVLAGPGSGKTRVVTHRIAWLIEHGAKGQSVLALTFTNKAADEMRSRVERLAPGASVWVGTYHRYCARLLRRYAPLVGLGENYTIYDAGDSARTLTQVLVRQKVDLLHFTPERIAATISWAKNNLILPEEYQGRPGNPLGAIVERVYPAYQARLAKLNAVDFDDLLVHVARLLRENAEIRQMLDERHRYVLVDEYQDTNLAQYAIARALSVDYPNLAVTGDPDQSIYGWRGANLKNILDFEHDYPGVRVVRLEQNYRSTQRILRVASELIARNVKRKQKDLFTENGEGKPVKLTAYANGHDEAVAIAGRIASELASGSRQARDFAIFYRVNALSRSFELALREYGVPYQLVRGVEFFQRKEIRDILAYLQLINNPSDDVALGRIINTPPRGIGKTTLERLAHYASSHGLSLLEAVREAAGNEWLKPRARKPLAAFLAMFDRIVAVSGRKIEELLSYVLIESGYKQPFEQSDDEEDQQRLANIEELLTVARDFDERNGGERRLEEFLEETSLVGETDDWETAGDRVTLMTLHASKGLEFPVVFLVAIEEGLLPHERCRDNLDQLEEERRLMFVGLTRAREELYLSRAEYRDFRGQHKMTVPSMFLMELPRSEMEVEDWGQTAAEGQTFYQAPKPNGRPLPPRAAMASIPASRPAAEGPRLTTAAELHNGDASPPPHPDEFVSGMVVRHPELGLGRVVELCGAGDDRQATVQFVSAAGRQTFVLTQSPLRPVRPNGGSRTALGAQEKER